LQGLNNLPEGNGIASACRAEQMLRSIKQFLLCLRMSDVDRAGREALASKNLADFAADKFLPAFGLIWHGRGIGLSRTFKLTLANSLISGANR
jgi:hypothetical protein